MASGSSLLLSSWNECWFFSNKLYGNTSNRCKCRVAIFEKKLVKGSFWGKMLEKLEFNILFSRPRLEKLGKVYFSLFRIYYIYPCLFISARGCPVYVDAMIYYLG